MDTLTIEELSELIRWVNCISPSRVAAVYGQTLEQIDKGYLAEKHQLACKRPLAWLCDLDLSSLRRLVGEVQRSLEHVPERRVSFGPFDNA